jgi:hypothetical protein
MEQQAQAQQAQLTASYHEHEASDLSMIVLAEASRQVGLAERELRRCEKVYESLKNGRLNEVTVRDMRLLLNARV